MIQRILTPLDNSNYTKTAMKYTCEIAKKRNAEVTGIVVLDYPDIDRKIGPIAPGGMELAEMLEKKELQEAQAHIDKLVDTFSGICTEQNVKHREFEYQGRPSESIIMESAFYDLLVIGMRTYFHFETSNKPGNSLEEILDHTITPILAVPEDFKKIENVLIVCDSTPASARAMQRFSHFAENSGYNITLLMEHKEEEYAEFYLKRAKGYLGAYGITDIKTERVSHSVKNVIEEKYIDNVDLIVLGMHQHKSLKEFVVGSLPQYLINENKKPLFIVQ